MYKLAKQKIQRMIQIPCSEINFLPLFYCYRKLVHLYFGLLSGYRYWKEIFLKSSPLIERGGANAELEAEIHPNHILKQYSQAGIFTHSQSKWEFKLSDLWRPSHKAFKHNKFFWQIGLGMESSLNIWDAASCCDKYRGDFVAMEFLRDEMDSIPINCQLSCFFPEIYIVGEWQGWTGTSDLKC